MQCNTNNGTLNVQGAKRVNSKQHISVIDGSQAILECINGRGKKVADSKGY